MKRKKIIPEKVRKLLTDGLKAGYAGEAKTGEARRGKYDFGLTSSHFENSDGSLVYHDEWVDGGGQELVDTFPERDQWTRTYAGGVAKPEILSALGLTPKDVTGYLKKKLQELGDRTRLDQDCFPPQDGDWRYLYLAVQYHEFPVINGIEKIEFKGKNVFIHLFGISPVK